MGMLEKAETKKTAMVELIGELFHHLDADRSGRFTFEELDTHLYDADFQGYLAVLGIGPNQAKELFMILDLDGSGEINIDEFTYGCLRIMGPPKNSDIIASLFQGKKIITMLESLLKSHQPRD